MGGAAHTGLGGTSAPEVIPSARSGSKERDALIRECSKDAFVLFFESFGYCDAGVDGNEIRIGIEPAYQFEPLKVIVLTPDINECAFITGRAVGLWASAVISKIKMFCDYKNKSKFVRFIEKWHPILFP